MPVPSSWGRSGCLGFGLRLRLRGRRGARDAGDGALRDTHADAFLNLQRQLVVLDAGDLADDAARRRHVVALLNSDSIFWCSFAFFDCGRLTRKYMIPNIATITTFGLPRSPPAPPEGAAAWAKTLRVYATTASSRATHSRKAPAGQELWVDCRSRCGPPRLPRWFPPPARA